MMGSTLLSVDAAELGDRALLDSLLPHSYRPHLKGPFLMLSETPTNDAVNFVTGAGGFLQQVIFGWTGLRIGEGGLDPAFPALLPSHITRLVLRNVHVARQALRRRGGLERPTHHPDGARAARHEVPAGRLPVLAFPEPGVDDPAAYAGYQTRFYRDSRNNTVQIYLEPSGGRVVNLFANAANESIGFTVRDDRGRPRRPGVGRGGGARSPTRGDPQARVPAHRPESSRRAGLVRPGLDAGRARLPVLAAAPRAVHRARRSGSPRSRCWWPTSLALAAEGAAKAPRRAGCHRPSASCVAAWLPAIRMVSGQRRVAGPGRATCRSTDVTAWCWRFAGTRGSRRSSPTGSDGAGPVARGLGRSGSGSGSAPTPSPSRRWRARRSSTATSCEFLAASARPAARARGAGRRAAEQPRKADGRAAQLRDLLRPRHDDDRAHDAADLDRRRWRST